MTKDTRKSLPNKIRSLREATANYQSLKEKYEALNHQLVEYKTSFAPGHFYSPYADMKDVERRSKQLFDRSKRKIPGIDVREEAQLQFLKVLSKHYSDLPYKTKASTAYRYRFANPAYSYTDAIVLFCMLNELKPRRIIEIGSGFSSALMLDTNEKFFKNSIDLTFVEPYPELLLSLARSGDRDNFRLIDKNLSEVDASLFGSLKSGDILFVDSTHVSKIGSDVNQIIFSILPLLNEGVIVHIHDVFYPFEYPREWILEQRAWNEDYMLRAFLCGNQTYEILFFNHFLNLHHQDELSKLMPLTAKNTGGSIWLRKIK